MKILVTGGAGFLGSHACEQLLSSGHAVVALDNFDGSYSRRRKRRNLAAAQTNPNFKLVEGDYGDRLMVTEVLKAEKFDAVLHLAGHADHRLSCHDSLVFERTNVGNLIPFLEALRECGPRQIVAASSRNVYGPDCPQPWREDASCMTSISPYGASKRAAEIFLGTYAGLYGFKVIILRIFSTYGPRQRPDMVAYQYARALLTGEVFPQYAKEISSSRDLTYVSDIVDGMIAALNSGFKQPYSIYNLGSGIQIETQQLLRTLEEITGRPRPTVDYQGVQPGDVGTTLANIDKARTELFFQPTVLLREGLEKFVAWMQEDLKAEPPEPKKIK
jgi:UDP-glucuronate 4-epimerase